MRHRLTTRPCSSSLRFLRNRARSCRAFDSEGELCVDEDSVADMVLVELYKAKYPKYVRDEPESFDDVYTDAHVCVAPVLQCGRARARGHLRAPRLARVAQGHSLETVSAQGDTI